MPAMLKYRLICRAETTEDETRTGASATAIGKHSAEVSLPLLLWFLRQEKFSYTELVGICYPFVCFTKLL